MERTLNRYQGPWALVICLCSLVQLYRKAVYYPVPFIEEDGNEGNKLLSSSAGVTKLPVPGEIRCFLPLIQLKSGVLANNPRTRGWQFYAVC